MGWGGQLTGWNGRHRWGHQSNDECKCSKTRKCGQNSSNEITIKLEKMKQIILYSKMQKTISKLDLGATNILGK